LQANWITAGDFPLLIQTRNRQVGDTLRIYIEGDGFAYMRPGVPAIDPSPNHPLALELAAIDTAPNVAWIARPCQYTMIAKVQSTCPERYWTSHRMAPEVVNSINAAVSFIVEKTKANGVELIGYSGGGAIAVLVAARRTDVVALRTVAGNLDHVAFTRYHKVTPMSASLNAADVIDQVRHIPQVHYAGAEDPIVPAALIESVVARVGGNARAVIVRGATHVKGWEAFWRKEMGKRAG
jgi:pimeloyl-ACP methyl ester carboxylesterase